MSALTLCDREVSSEVLLGGEGVVCGAVERKVVGRRRSAAGKGLVMVEFEALRFATALAASVDVRAAGAVAFEDGATYGRGDVAVALARVRVIANTPCGARYRRFEGGDGNLEFHGRHDMGGWPSRR